MLLYCWHSINRYLCLLLICYCVLSANSEPGGCDLLIYTNVTELPTRHRDSRDTCPEGDGARSYVLSSPENVGHGVMHHGSLEPSQPQLKEVAPDRNQHFKCLLNRKCSLVVRGFALGFGDALAVLPAGASKCPPERIRKEGSSSAEIIIVQAEFVASLASTRLPTPEATFTIFVLPDGFTTKPASHTVCYAPILSSPGRTIDQLEARDFHYVAGTVEIGDSFLDCDFEEPAAKPGLGQSNLADAILPCGFKNFRNRWQSNLVWELGSGATETAGTGPSGDSTPGLGGGGTYLYMDSPGYALGASAFIISAPIPYPSGVYCSMFSYHMWGESVATLRAYMHEVKLSAADRRETTLLGDWGVPAWVAVGNKGNEWHQGAFEFKATPMQTFQLGFEALAGKSEYGDIAIDDVSIRPGGCSDEITMHFPKTLGLRNEKLVCGEVRLITGSHSTDKSWYVDGAVSCAGRSYSLDQLNQTAWLPCCVPHVGVYKLVLEDDFGDGWTGSYLEFLFFDRLMTFGRDSFQQSGYDTNYRLVIGVLEIVDIQKLPGPFLGIDVRLAHPDSFAWCGVVEAGKQGKVLNADLTPSLLKRYGVRSSSPTSGPNEVVHMQIKNVLKERARYDLYCHSEVVGTLTEDDDATAQQLKQQISASRLRFSTDDEAPSISDVTVSSDPAISSVNVAVVVNEPSAAVWCVGIRAPSKESNDLLFGPIGELEGVLGSNSKEQLERLSRYFGENGELALPDGPDHRVATLNGLIPNSEYEVYCYAEDESEPDPNRMTGVSVKETMHRVRTLSKAPSVRLSRRETMHRGFKLYVVADTPGRAWCAAAPADYGIPDVGEIVDVGASVDIKNPGEEVLMEVRGVEANSAYTIYCVGGYDSDGTGFEYSEGSEMIKHSVPVVSYGKYCDEGADVEIFTTATEVTPFHPVTSEEEVRVRNYLMGRPELGLEGLYRITLLPNKTEIKDFYMGRRSKPLRYARVRVGRCVNNVGVYEQLKVGPLNGNTSLSYERVAKPVETDCGGYNPQGVFGRRLSDQDDSMSIFSRWLKSSFGYKFGTDECNDDLFRERKVVGSARSNSRSCLDLGPIIVEEVCDEVSCEDRRTGRVWVGLRTPEGDALPIYFIYNLPLASSPAQRETAEAWVKRIVRDKELPEEFLKLWEFTEFWIDGQVFKSISDFLSNLDLGLIPRFSPEIVSERRRLQESEIFKQAQIDSLRHLEPQPYPGAAGTAGPAPSRTKKREGLEYRAHPEHVEAQGKRFQVESSSDEEEYTITYAGWNMTVTNDRDTALRVYHVSFHGQSVAFEIGLMEALAHYTVSERNWFFLDSWYGGLGAAARKVHKGIECPKTSLSLFWDGSLCVFEQDMARPTRVHWKGGEIQDGAPHTTLVLRQMLTVSNYDYVTDYRFHLTGIFEASISFTGELYAGIEVPWYSARQKDYGVQVTGAMRFAALHSHMAVWKVDLDVGPSDHWKENSVLLTEVIPDPSRPGANKLRRSFAETERDAIYFRNDTRALIYEVVDEKIRIFGNVGGWRVVAFPGINPLHHEFELYQGPAAWAKYRIFSSVHKYGEMDSTLPRDNKYPKRPATAVDRYLIDDEPIRKADVVTWIADGIFHVPVIEDMPFTVPVGNTLGWMVKPANLFLEDPSMDLSNSMGGGVEDPGTCAVVRMGIGEIEPVLKNTWSSSGHSRPVRDVLL